MSICNISPVSVSFSQLFHFTLFLRWKGRIPLINFLDTHLERPESDPMSFLYVFLFLVGNVFAHKKETFALQYTKGVLLTEAHCASPLLSSLPYHGQSLL